MPESESEVAGWDRIRREMLENLRESVRLGVITREQYPKVMADFMVMWWRERDKADLRDFLRLIEELEDSGPEFAELAIHARQTLNEKEYEARLKGGEAD